MNSSGLRPFVPCILLALFSCAERAFAQGNYQAAPLGGRSALLGGTGVALGLDGAAPFLNPASIVRIADRNIAFSARFFRLSQRTFGDLHQPGAVDPAYGPLRLSNTDESSTNLRTVPDTTCFFFSRTSGRGPRLAGKSRLAICLAKTEERDFEKTALNYEGSSANRRVDQSQSFSTAWGAWSFGPTFAFYLTDDLAVGASLNVTRTRLQSTASVASIAEDLGTGAAVASAFQSADYGSSWDGVMHLGAVYRLSSRVTLGASVRTPSLHFTGSYTESQDSRFDGASWALAHSGGGGSFTVRSPVRLSLGVGAEYERFRIETNVFVHSGVAEYAHAELDRDSVSASGGTVAQRSRTSLSRNESVNPVVNVGIGAEYFFSKNVSLLTGLATDASALEDLSGSDSRLFHDRFDAWHAGLGISSYTEFGDLVVGLRGDYMSGEVTAINGFAVPAERDVISAHEWAVTLILAGRVNLSTVAKAAQNVTEAVSGEAPAPSPTLPTPLQPPKRN